MIILNDFNTSVEKALTEIDPNWKKYPGVIVCGTHNPNTEAIDDLLNTIKECRENNIPFLGICFGMQLMAIEYMGSIDGELASSEEFQDPIPGTKINFVVKKMPELRVGMHPGMVNMEITTESFWHNYKVDIDSFPQLGDAFWINEVNDVVTWMKLKDRENFYGVQFHPEYQSSKDKPHPVLVDFINKCKGYEKVSGSSTPITDLFKKHGK